MGTNIDIHTSTAELSHEQGTPLNAFRDSRFIEKSDIVGSTSHRADESDGSFVERSQETGISRTTAALSLVVHVVVLTLILGIPVFLLFRLPGEHVFKGAIIDFTKKYPAAAIAAIIGVYSILISLLVPTEILIFAACYLFSRQDLFTNKFGVLAAALTCWTAMVISCNMVFFLFRKFLNRPLGRYVKRWRYINFVSRRLVNDMGLLFALRVAPLIPFTLTNILLASTDIEYKRLMISLLATLFVVLLTAGVAGGVLHFPSIIQSDAGEKSRYVITILHVLILISVIITLYVGGTWAQRSLRIAMENDSTEEELLRNKNSEEGAVIAGEKNILVHEFPKGLILNSVV